MNGKGKTLSGRIADEILEMITIEKRFLPGEKLPNENEMAKELGVSRTTLREAVRILVAHNVVEIQRGKGTFVTENTELSESFGLDKLTSIRMNMTDLYEIRLIFEPQIAYYAALRATDKELETILFFGRETEKKIKAGEDRTETEVAFHNAIAKATHNEFIHRLMPIINSAIHSGVVAGEERENEKIKESTVADHKMLMEFLQKRNPMGAKTAMKMHLLHAIEELSLTRKGE